MLNLMLVILQLSVIDNKKLGINRYKKLIFFSTVTNRLDNRFIIEKHFY